MFKKIRFTTEYLFFYFKKNFVFLLLGLFFGIIGFTQRINFYLILEKLQEKTLIIGLEGNFTSNSLPQEINQLITYGLTQIEDNNKITISPLVESLDIKADNLEYVFKLKPFIWHNRKKLVSSDINFSIPGISVSYPDQSTVSIKLTSTFTPIMALLSQPLYLNDSLIGLGEYKVSSVIFQESHIKELQLKNPNQPKIVYRFYQNDTDLVSGFKLGEVNQMVISQIPPEFSFWPKIKVVPEIKTNRYLAVFLNNEKIAVKTDRQAIAYATPKTNEKNLRCLGPISTNSWAYNPNIKEYNFNPVRSQELFNNPELKSLKMLVTDRKLLSIAENIKSSWEKTLQLKTEISVFADQSELNNFDAILAYGSIPVDPDQFYFWHSTQKSNITKLNNPRIDKLLEEGRTSSDLQERKKIYQDFQRYLLEESPAIFLEFPIAYTISRVK